MMHRISLVVATKDRPDDLGRLLSSLHNQSVRPAEVVVVDAGRNPVEAVVLSFPGLHPRYLRHWPPSGAAQRNAGIRACDPAATLIGFADDDTTFEPEAFANMLRFWQNAPPDVLGAAFNIRNYPDRGRQRLKHSRLVCRLGLYSPRPGGVAPSGWQTVLGELAETRFVDWLPSTAVIWRREVFGEHLFDEFFESYSYLEDLDFSYSVSRKGRLAVVAGAGYRHFPSPHGRISPRRFGQYEVRNRLYFVRKHNLSLARCRLALAIRFGMSVWAAAPRLDGRLLERARGNVDAVLERLAFRGGIRWCARQPRKALRAMRSRP